MKPYASNQSKKEQVRDMFDRIAPTYDRLNHTLSFHIDRWWRWRVVRMVRRMRPQRVLDMATGTGDLAILLARRIPDVRVKGVDLSEGMLDVAARKVAACGLEDRITLETGDAERLDVATASVDAVTVAFGVRNFENPAAGLRELARTIRPGGRIFVLEFSTPTLPLWGSLYRWYSHRVLPRIGGAVSKERRAYDYLPQSVDEFPQPERFCRMLAEAGFADCRAHSLCGGVAQIYEGVRP